MCGFNFGNDNCWWIIILVILFLFCCNNNGSSCGCTNDCACATGC